MMHLIKILPILFVVGMIGLIVSCEDDKSSNPQDQVPTIPPQSSFVIKFDEFPDTTKIGRVDNPVLTKRNWAWAASNVKYWNSVLTVALAIPVAAFVESFNHQPVQQSDGSWLWQYNVSVDEQIYTAKLFGLHTGDGVDWRMLLSKQGEYTDFEWFTGFSNTSATEGTWSLNKDPNSPNPFLNIEWNRSVQNETAEIKYILVSPSILQQGSYIFYEKTNEVPLNRFYQFYNNNLMDIKWSYESNFGRVKNLLYFEDETWHCWDERLEDTECEE